MYFQILYPLVFLIFLMGECVFSEVITPLIFLSAMCQEFPPIHTNQHLQLSDLKIFMSQMGENGISFYFVFLRLIKFKIFPHVDWPLFHVVSLPFSYWYFVFFSFICTNSLYSLKTDPILVIFLQIPFFLAHGLHFQSLKGVLLMNRSSFFFF